MTQLCVSGLVNGEVGPLVGTVTFRLETLNMRQKVLSNPDTMRPDIPGTILTRQKCPYFADKKIDIFTSAVEVTYCQRCGQTLKKKYIY